MAETEDEEMELINSMIRAVELQKELLEKMKEFDLQVELLEMQSSPMKGDRHSLKLMRYSCGVHRINLHALLTNYARFAGEEFDTLEKEDRSYIRRLKAHREATRIANEVELRDAVNEL